ncbi:Gag-pol fusion protein [Phytophthora megakarya]|uniref:Gag-pol fusion protein n=1 Tax=Phytophthora megakarya TaxID=4795 RepID=A0A225WIP3_9STRA|nr:Gag-pol fusion protein [Phytophthora megakarya]
MAPQFEMHNGVLMRRVHLRARAGPANTKLVPVIPLRFIETMFYYCHGDLMSAHIGKPKTLEKRMPVKDLSGPFSLVVVDAIGPLPTTDRGNKYILVFVNYFTRCAEVLAIQALDSITCVNVMIDRVICRHGVPEQLLRDRGTNFTSELARSLYQTLAIKKLFGAAYHPPTQGLIGRFSLLGMLRLFVHETQTDWDVYLPRVLFAYRTSYHESLRDTPFFSLYGRDPKLTLELAFLNTTKNWKSNEVANYRRQLYKSLHDSRRMVERQLIKAQDRNDVRSQKRKVVSYDEGDSVWVFQHFRAKRGEKRPRNWRSPGMDRIGF